MIGGIKMKKTYKVTKKNDNILIFSITIYDKKFEKQLLRVFKKIKCYCNIIEVQE